jgi:hypothetical protein
MQQTPPNACLYEAATVLTYVGYPENDLSSSLLRFEEILKEKS